MEIQSSGSDIEEASPGEKVAVSIDNVMIGRHINEEDIIYTFISSEDFEALKKTELSEEEKQILKEVRKIKKK